MNHRYKLHISPLRAQDLRDLYKGQRRRGPRPAEDEAGGDRQACGGKGGLDKGEAGGGCLPLAAARGLLFKLRRYAALPGQGLPDCFKAR